MYPHKIATVLEDQIIWYNNNIKFRNKLLMFKKWKDAGIMYLSDIVTNNRFISLFELRQIFQRVQMMFLNYKSYWQQYQKIGKH